MGCRVPAGRADADHTTDHAHGGPTSSVNLGLFCRHDHRLKHEGGWRLEQPEPGVFVWTSRLGQRYLVRPTPVIEELPAPIERADESPEIFVPADYGADRPIFDDSPPPPGPAPPVPPPVLEPDTDPPF